MDGIWRKRNVLLAVVVWLGPVDRADADITLGGSLLPERSVTYHEGMAVTDCLDSLEWIGCARIRVVSKDRGGKIFVIDLPKVLSQQDKNLPMRDGDFVEVPQHMWPCLSERQERDLARLISEYNLITRKRLTFPSDWEARVNAAAGSCSKIEKED